jgi:hypothetical protein
LIYKTKRLKALLNLPMPIIRSEEKLLLAD